MSRRRRRQKVRKDVISFMYLYSPIILSPLIILVILIDELYR